VSDPDHITTVRTRHLNLNAAIEADRKISAAPPERRPAIAWALAEVFDLDVRFVARLRNYAIAKGGALCPAFSPYLEPRTIARLVLGEAPEVVRPGLTRGEAVASLKEGISESRLPRWLLESDEAFRESQLGPAARLVRSVPVARWILKIARRPEQENALVRYREFRGPHGEVVHGRYLDYLGEVAPEDLTGEGGTGVDAVMRRAIARVTAARLAALAEENRELAPAPPWEAKLPKGVRVLRTSRALVEEGKDMEHCVGGYAPYVQRKESIILALRSDDGTRSTVELRPMGNGTYTVAQHYGRRNTAPSKSCQALLDQVLAVIYGHGENTTDAP
jgi:hypothetical protein